MVESAAAHNAMSGNHRTEGGFVLYAFSRCVLLCAVTLLGAVNVLAAGYSIYEQGAKASSMAGAFSATADDPTAIFYNVAGIAFQRNLAATAGATWIMFNNEFRGGNYDFPGPDAMAGYEDHNFVIPTVYAVVPIGENLTFGVGQFAAFGLRTDWENPQTFPGRFISMDADLKTASIQPSLAWKTSNDRFAIGAGVEYRLAEVILKRNAAAINPFTQRIVDVAHARLESERGDDIGYNVGILYAGDRWRFGVNHRTSMEIDLEGRADFTQIPTGNAQLDAIIAATAIPPDQDIRTSIPFPSITQFAVATTLVPNWTVEFNAVHMTWSKFEALEVEFETTPSANINREENWRDVWSYRLGAERPVTDRWSIRLGALYDETPQPVEAVGPLLPDSNRAAVTFGLGYRRGSWRLDLSQMVLHFEDRDTLGRSEDNFNGIYQTSANLLTFNIGYSF
jgi:long-chain fatty acid transport protein